MHKIKIDTSKRYEKSVRLLNGKKEVASKFGDIDIVSKIAEVLKENNLRVSDIDEFLANQGPGSFTGLKIGVTIVNVLNWALGKKELNELVMPKYGKEPNITIRKKS